MINNDNKLDQPITDLAVIKQFLPHREPMIMVDGLLFYNEKKAISTFTILKENLFIENGYFAETGLIEHMAQTAALHVGYKNYSEKKPVKEGFIGAIKSCEIVELPQLNITIKTEVEITYEIAAMTMVKLKSMIDEKIIATAEMSTVLKEE
ncbi:hypothetical protein [Winogradskyella ursingii]|uniref:hypothetical protein n=1 Tax=Winogradskyella ursingii TaxID=2686079 RepID=UPI0015C7212E|nr:hypothetical protein [Winogradskyella ursingii]